MDEASVVMGSFRAVRALRVRNRASAAKGSFREICVFRVQKGF